MRNGDNKVKMRQEREAYKRREKSHCDGELHWRGHNREDKRIRCGQHIINLIKTI